MYEAMECDNFGTRRVVSVRAASHVPDAFPACVRRCGTSLPLQHPSPFTFGYESNQPAADIAMRTVIDMSTLDV